MSRRKTAFPKEAFLSHAHPDLAFVRRVAHLLRDHGIKAWYSEHHIVGAQQWHDEIGRALARCDWFVLILTPSAVKSKWVKRELLYALRAARYEDRIAPVLRKACDYSKLSWTLGSFQIVDFTRPFAKACPDLLRVWGIRPRRPWAPPKEHPTRRPGR